MFRALLRDDNLFLSMNIFLLVRFAVVVPCRWFLAFSSCSLFFLSACSFAFLAAQETILPVVVLLAASTACGDL